MDENLSRLAHQIYLRMLCWNSERKMLINMFSEITEISKPNMENSFILCISGTPRADIPAEVCNRLQVRIVEQCW